MNVTDITEDMTAVLDAIRNATSAPDDMPDHRIWAAERQLVTAGLIYRDETTGDYVAR
jgi:uncharacterized protein (DUF736 family)